MAVIKKTLFPKNLDRYSVLVNDIEPNSKYFQITELPDTFTGGKNAFLIAGSAGLVADTKLQIELKDAAGNVIYHEPGEGYISSSLNGVPFVTEYYEGVSKVVSVYVYPDTAYGPCTLTILGELSEYEDTNGINAPVPTQWENQYNVKWTKQINVNPNLANTTKIRFYQRPAATITEILNPIYTIISGSKVASAVTQSFANIKLSQLETFAGDVKRVKVFRTSLNDISDYNLIQDILIESKELLTSYGLTGSVIGNTGIFTSEVLKNYWNSSSLNVVLNSERIDAGVRLTGSGYFIYTSSLDIKSTNTYELNFDAFYSSSTDSNLGIYLSSGSMSSSIGTLYGTSPTKNLIDNVIPFKINNDYPTASLYFSQSQGDWHLANVSLRLSQDTAFSPDEVSFVTTMPTIVGNETYNFKFEFYDVNNNYVPVAVTQSATFIGGSTGSAVDVNFIISSSVSQSNDALNRVSSSISGTVTLASSSISGTLGNVSSSVSGTIGRVSGSISGSIYSLSGSVSSSLTLTSGSVTLVSSSLVFTSQSLSSSLTTLSASVSSSFSFNSSQSAYQVYSASQYLDKFIFTDENGKLNQPPTASAPGLYLGSEYLGYYNGTGTSGWKTYMDNQGDFYLTSSNANGGFLAWNASAATLQIQGAINIQGGNAATTSSVSASINSATASLSTSVATTTFTTATGLIAKPPSVLVGSTSGLYLGSTYLGYYDGNNWKTYMANNGNFYLSGAGSDSLTWAGGVLTINGAINITGGNVQTSLSSINSTTASLNSATSSLNTSVSNINSSITNINSATSSLDSRIFTNSSGLVNKTPSTTTSGLYLGQTYLGYYNGSAWKTYMSNTGNFYLSGTGTNGLSWDGTTLSITGNLAVGSSVPNSVVSGLGALATQNTVTNTQVTGLGALATRNDITLSYVTNAGSLAGLSSISAAQIDASAVTNAKIAADAVTEGKIAADAVTSGKISANAVVADKIAANAIVADKIAANAITAGKIAASAIEADKIAAGAITAGKISAGAVTADKITVSDLSALNASIGGWSINSDNISKTSGGKTITLNSSGKEISFTGGSTSNVRIGTEGIYTLNSSFANTTYIGDGGIMMVGSWTNSGGVPDNYISNFVYNDGYNGYARLVVNNAIGTANYNAVEFYSSPVSNMSTLKVTGGGVYIGSVGVGNYGYVLNAAGNATFTGDVTANTSDGRLKTNIKNIDNPLEKISKINGVYFNWNQLAKKLTDKNTEIREVGFIAQEVEKVLPEIIKPAAFDVQLQSGENYLTIQYEKIVPLLVECIKELKKEIEELKKNK